jgi:hypothetical protein
MIRWPLLTFAQVPALHILGEDIGDKRAIRVVASCSVFSGRKMTLPAHQDACTGLLRTGIGILTCNLDASAAEILRATADDGDASDLEMHHKRCDAKNLAVFRYASGITNSSECSPPNDLAALAAFRSGTDKIEELLFFTLPVQIMVSNPEISSPQTVIDRQKDS